MCDEQELKFSGDYWTGVQDTLGIVTEIMEEVDGLPAEVQVKTLIDVLVELDGEAQIERRKWIVGQLCFGSRIEMARKMAMRLHEEQAH